MLSEFLLILHCLSNLLGQYAVLLLGDAPQTEHIDGKYHNQQRHDAYGNSYHSKELGPGLLFGYLALFSLCIINDSEFSSITTLLAYQCRVIHLGNLQSHLQGRVLLSSVVLRAELRQQIVSNSLEVKLYRPARDEVVEEGVVIGCLVITVGQH